MSRTVIYALVNLLVAALAVAGVQMPEEMQQALRDNAEAIIAAGLAINGVVVWILRRFTATPLTGIITKESP